MRRLLLTMLLLVVFTIAFTACSSSEPEEESSSEPMEDEHMEDEDMAEHDEEDMADHDEEDMADHDEEDMAHAHVEPPDEFASLANPYAGDSEAVAAGKEIFEINCVTCHGPNGAGDGDAAAGLDPKPANLSDNEMMSMVSDGYLFWRVTKGGAFEPFNSAMVSWEGALSEEQRWEVISFIRTLSEQ